MPCGRLVASWFDFSFCSAAIILRLPARCAPPASAWNSRQRENAATIIVAAKPSTICITIEVT